MIVKDNIEMVEIFPALAKKSTNSQRSGIRLSDQEAANFLKKIGVT